MYNFHLQRGKLEGAKHSIVILGRYFFNCISPWQSHNDFLSYNLLFNWFIPRRTISIQQHAPPTPVHVLFSSQYHLPLLHFSERNLTHALDQSIWPWLLWRWVSHSSNTFLELSYYHHHSLVKMYCDASHFSACHEMLEFSCGPDWVCCSPSA